MNLMLRCVCVCVCVCVESNKGCGAYVHTPVTFINYIIRSGNSIASCTPSGTAHLGLACVTRLCLPTSTPHA